MRLLTTKQIADVLQVTTQRAYELARCPHFFPPGVVVRLGRQIRFNEDALRSWIASGGNDAQEGGKTQCTLR